jgi:hypothetical protein
LSIIGFVNRRRIGRYGFTQYASPWSTLNKILLELEALTSVF